MLISIVLLAFLSLGAVSAFDNSNDTIGNNIALDSSDKMLNADESNGNILASASYNKTIYVNYTGDDSGTGGQNSPYASLNKGISSVNASDNAVIYLSAGRFTGENNTNHPDITFAKVDTEAEQGLASALGVTSIPTLMVFRDDVLVYRDAGALP